MKTKSMTGPGAELDKSLVQLQEELNKCAKCGACHSVCPIFAQTKMEKDVARGKIALVEAAAEGALPDTQGYAHVLNNCLLCLACVENCSSSVRVDKIVIQAREALMQKKGLSWPRRKVHAVLSAGSRQLDTFFKRGSLLQRLLFRRIPESSGLRRRFALPGVEAEQVLPRLARTPFRRQHPEMLKASDQAGQVVFFTGCASNYIFPSIAEALVKVLNALNISVIIPKHQNCCGAPVQAAGDKQTFLTLAERNLEVLSSMHQYSQVVVCCSSGGYMFKKVYPEAFVQDTDLSQAAVDLASRTYDISEYLLQVIGLEKIAQKITSPCRLRTTYHDPCHLKRAQGLAQEPRQLLRLCCQEFLLEMQDPDRCCGLGGTYGLTHRDMSKRIRAHKVQNILGVQAEQVVTGCPACMIQLMDGLHNQDPGIRVRHTIQILAQAMGLS